MSMSKKDIVLFFETGRGSVGALASAYSLSRQICIVLSRGKFVNKELTSKEHITSCLCLYVLFQSAAKLNESLIVNWLVEMGCRI